MFTSVGGAIAIAPNIRFKSDFNGVVGDYTLHIPKCYSAAGLRTLRLSSLSCSGSTGLGA